MGGGLGATPLVGLILNKVKMSVLDFNGIWKLNKAKSDLYPRLQYLTSVN